MASVPIAVHPTLTPVLPALRPGSTVGCTGTAAISTAFLLAAQASAQGSWIALAGIPGLNPQACREAGIAIERMVVVGEGSSAEGAGRRGDETWGNVLATLIDGFDLVVFGAGPALRAGTVRRLQARIQARRGVLVVTGAPGSFSCDVQIHTVTRWHGLGHGHGHLRAREVQLEVGGRRVPARRRGCIWLPGPDGAIGPFEPAHDAGEVRPLRRTG